MGCYYKKETGHKPSLNELFLMKGQKLWVTG
jgi:hypothetical protein